MLTISIQVTDVLVFTIECGIVRFLYAMRVFDVRASSSPVGYLCAKFYFYGDLCCWARPWRTRGSAIAEELHDALRQLKYYGRFLTELLTRSSANPKEPCEHTVSWNRAKCGTNVQRIACENVCNRWMTFKVIQGHCHCHHLIGHILFPISLPLQVYANLARFSRY